MAMGRIPLFSRRMDDIGITMMLAVVCSFTSIILNLVSNGGVVSYNHGIMQRRCRVSARELEHKMMGGVDFWRAVVNVTVEGEAGKNGLVFNSRHGGFEVEKARELAFSEDHPVGSEHECFISGRGDDRRISFSVLLCWVAGGLTCSGS
uniref:Uncharacterized protein n=1 Tax=Guillardia theta TaxID=55529 RepID=A0A7S4ULQ1_GUITH|mmetsp:Transcript_46663/g.146311  ORF Transcript_46663/g.146311 Transcript_46663/m.146311 type:complete len:149 (+) Transcript_46663:77-523(+)